MPYYAPNYYNPYLYQAQPAPVQTPQAPSQSSGIVWIGSEKEAALYPVAPNAAVTLWNQNEPVVYLKQADAMGKPTLKTYDLVERSETDREARSSSDGKVSAYATKDELAAVVSAVKDIDEVITSLTKDIDKLKAGKKPVRKYEDDEE